MSTVKAIADRAFREHLHPLDDQPVTITFASEASRTATTWTYGASTLSPEELDLLAPGVVVEADDGELALVTDVDVAADTLAVVRGHLGTTATKHAAGSTITVAPLYGRRAVLEAVKDEVVSLYPDVHRRGAEELVTSLDPIEVPASVVTPTGLIVKYGAGYRRVKYTFLADFPPSATGKALFVDALREGYTAYLTFEGAFERPTYDTDDVADFGVEAAWERILAVGAAMKAVAQRDVDQLSAEYVTEQLEREALPSETPHRVREGLRELRAVWLAQARRAQANGKPHPVVYNEVGAY